MIRSDEERTDLVNGLILEETVDPHDLELLVTRRRMLTDSVCEFELRAPQGSALPPFTPGAHLTVTTPSGQRRSYSLSGSPEDCTRYVVAVKREPAGRGGSASMVDDLAEGALIEASRPSNSFPLLDSPRYLLIAGGIGITPIRAMYHVLRARPETNVRLVYLARSRKEAAYLDELTGADHAGQVTAHLSAESGGADLWPWLAQPRDDTRVYCCGPNSLMDAVEALTMHWRPSRIHFERFRGVDPLTGAMPFTAVWAPTGLRVAVPAERSLLQALQNAGLPVEASCESGTCGTCRLALVAGEAVHRDLVLSPEEHGTQIMPCVSRALAEELEVAPRGWTGAQMPG